MARFAPGYLQVGMRFIHAQRGVECRITAVTKSHIHYRAFGVEQEVRVHKRNFKTAKVESWV